MTTAKKDTLNPSQHAAVTHPGGPLLVLAGAGSGKTKIITERISYLVTKEGVSPHRILAVTFTNKAANEMRERVSHLIPGSARSLWIGTFHSTALRILKRDIDKLPGFDRNFAIYDDADQVRLIKECMVRLNIGERGIEPRFVRTRIDRAKNRGGKPGDTGNDELDEHLSNIYELYEKEMRKLNALDFGDLLHVTVRLFEERPEVLHAYQEQFRHILVDEYQDTNHVQYRMVRMLSGKHENIFVVGDDNQSIYGWRGADITNILNFEKDFPSSSIIKLEKNYRSTKNILDAANGLITKNRNRHEKNLWTDNPEGEKLSYYEAVDEREEARYVVSGIESEASGGRSYRDIAVFYRTNNQSRVIEEELLRKDVPYTIVGATGFYQRAEIRDLTAFLRVIANPNDDLSLRRIINVPPRGIGKSTIDEVARLAANEDIPFVEAIRKSVSENAFPQRTTLALKKFLSMLEGLIEFEENHGIGETIDRVLEKTGYLELLEKEPERRENVGEIFNVAAEFEREEEGAGVREFLDRITLSSDIDSYSGKEERAALMTLHSAKGLEFPVVFIIGMEEKLIPHYNSIKDDGDVEEERRLFYVGITRAREKLYLTGARSRRFFGKEERPTPSRFVSELPEELIEVKNYYGGLLRESARSFAPRSKASTRRSARASSAAPPPPKPGNSRYKPGQKIHHPSFGPGTITKVEGEGDTAKVTVSFLAHGVKKIIAAYLEGK
ncbi:MAG: UvrD-helicase domain-containing protein [Candidatus Dadabacteria bacterium]|nr:UvrD-helicase domain-containing protein [Candidatus Dadabacteria bacterium]